MHLLRYRNSSSDVMSVGVLRRDTISAIPGVTSQLWRLSREDLKAAVTGATGAEGKLADVAVAAPVDGCTEVWARGVTRADHRGGPRASGDELAGGRDRRCWPADSRAPRSGHTSGGVVTIASVDGPYPAATDPLHTSVGAAAIRRWLRPISYQDVPEELLPVDLRDGDTTVPRRIDGDLVLPALPPDTPPAGS